MQHSHQPEKRVKARQLQGQAASSGIARGKARVIAPGGELKDFKKGEVLVIDSIDPTMTFLAPLAAGIIERRGGMLIHGAIIAREYGIPCITGVVNATSVIDTGDFLTVDGYLGICTVQRKAPPRHLLSHLSQSCLDKNQPLLLIEQQGLYENHSIINGKVTSTNYHLTLSLNQYIWLFLLRSDLLSS